MRALPKARGKGIGLELKASRQHRQQERHGKIDGRKYKLENNEQANERRSRVREAKRSKKLRRMHELPKDKQGDEQMRLRKHKVLDGVVEAPMAELVRQNGHHFVVGAVRLRLLVSTMQRGRMRAGGVVRRLVCAGGAVLVCQQRVKQHNALVAEKAVVVGIAVRRLARRIHNEDLFQRKIDRARKSEYARLKHTIREGIVSIEQRRNVVGVDGDSEKAEPEEEEPRVHVKEWSPILDDPHEKRHDGQHDCVGENNGFELVPQPRSGRLLVEAMTRLHHKRVVCTPRQSQNSFNCHGNNEECKHMQRCALLYVDAGHCRKRIACRAPKPRQSAQHEDGGAFNLPIQVAEQRIASAVHSICTRPLKGVVVDDAM
eukprot:Opistho-2@58345